MCLYDVDDGFITIESYMPATSGTGATIDTVLAIVFTIDYLIMFYASEDK